jgi:hypothetical protein
MSTLRSKDRASSCSLALRMAANAARRAIPAIRVSAVFTPVRKQPQAAKSIGRDISSRFSSSYLSACDLSCHRRPRRSFSQR